LSLSTLFSINSQDFQLKIPNIFNFWSSKCHQSLLGNGRVVTKINAVNFNLIISKKYGQSSYLAVAFHNPPLSFNIFAILAIL